MKCFFAFIIVVVVSFCASAQSIRLTGTVFDPNGAVVTNAQIKAVDEKGRSISGSSNTDGSFEINLIPGLYAIDVSSPGFLTIRYNEFLVVNSTMGKMTMDFVLFGSKFHEPCGYSGADCLPGKSLIKSYEVRYSPRLKDIRDEFAPLPKSQKPD